MAAPLRSSNTSLLRLQTHGIKCSFAKVRWLRTSSVLQQKRKAKKNKNTDLDVKVDELFSKREATSTKSQKQTTRSEGAAPSFKEILHEKYKEACRSVLIRTMNSNAAVLSLTSIGGLKHAQFTTQDKLYMLAEFANESSITKLQDNAGFFSEQNQFPMRSRILYDTSSQKRKKHLPIPDVEEGNWTEKASNFHPVMDSLDEELKALCRRRTLDDGDLRIRFFICLLLEDMLRSILPDARVIPYGSCLNGFGWWNSDLDMMLCFNRDPYTPSLTQQKIPQHGAPASSLRQLTEVFSTERQLAQRTLAMIASLLDLTPRVHSVFKILNARVPIIRFRNVAVNLQCDISVEAMDSIKMTELLYLYSVSDPRVKPLMAGLKQWAISHKLTAGGEQQKPTTIGILAMLLFFLQTRTPPVVPTLQQMQRLANTSEMFYIDSVLYGLPTSPSRLPKSQNTESIESLLHGFFTFYSEFDFANKAISIIEGITYNKPADSSPIHMENPLCIGLNICRNVSNAHLEHFTSAMKEAALKIEAMASGVGTDQTKLATLCNDKPLESRLSILLSSDRATDSKLQVEMSELFAVEELDENNSSLNTPENDEIESDNQDFGQDEQNDKFHTNSLDMPSSESTSSTQAPVLQVDAISEENLTVDSESAFKDTATNSYLDCSLTDSDAKR